MNNLAALTAAAEVGSFSDIPPDKTSISDWPIAAQVGELRPTTQMIVRDMKASTIERCAQVVKELADKCNSEFGCDPYAQARLQEAEAEIRKLKDEPNGKP